MLQRYIRYTTHIIVNLILASLLISNSVFALDFSFTTKPSVAKPGQDVVVDVEIVNKVVAGSSGSVVDKKNLKIDFIESYPFSITRKSESIREPFDLCYSCTKKGAFFLYVDPKASSSVYPIYFEILDNDVIIRKEVLVEVKGVPDIIFDTTIVQESIKPGDAFNVTLKLNNFGTGSARNIKISQDSTSFVIEGDNLVFLGDLGIGESKNVTITFIANDNIKPGTHLLPLVINAQDTGSNYYNYSQKIGLRILNQAQINIRNLKISNANDLYDIRLRVENVGRGEAKDVTAELLTDYEGFKKNYIGKLGIDEDLPIIFTLFINDKGKQSIPMLIKYTDDLGSFSLQENIEFEIQRTFGSILKSLIIVVIVAVLIIGAFIWVRNKKILT